MGKPNLEAHEQWLIDIDNRVCYLENSQAPRQPEGKEDIPPEPEWTKKQWDFVLQLKAQILHQQKTLLEINNTLQEHLKSHWDRKKGIKKRGRYLK